MGIYPKLEIDLQKIKYNANVLTQKCKRSNINVAGVTKVFCAMPQIVNALVEGGIDMIADARIENLKKVHAVDLPKLLLRLPMISQADEVVRYSDYSLNSEIRTIEALGRAAKAQDKLHKVVLMVDLGDLREGVWPEEVIETVSKIMGIEGVELAGVGTNLTCYGGIIPSSENLGLLVSLAEKIENEFNVSLEIISGGNSSSLHLLEKEGQMPGRVNLLRIGEAIVLGGETAYGQPVEGAHQDAFTFAAEIIELKEKPSIPIGEVGLDAFGNKPEFVDRGLRKRAILGVGRQDVNIGNISPKDPDITIIGASSDHLIVDVTDCEKRFEVGDEIRFNVEYGALLQLATSEYVYKEFK